ncbi:MAG: winged helix-turn-helix domain-containing protein [Acidobacteria bacterium]|nr:winged helix-turn-helix domain-containing protein [Acidobacteriota bacterium]
MTSSGSGKKWRFGVFEVDLQRQELRKQGLRIKLQGQPLRLLMLLLERPGEIVTREQLQSHLWDSDVFVDFDHSLNKAINKLRDALGDSAESPRFVETLSRRGYRFIAPVQSINTDESALELSRESSPAAADQAEVSSTTSRQFHWAVSWLGTRKKYVVAVLAIPLLAVAMIPSLFRGPGAVGNYSVAVLPFENIGDRSDSEYLSDGLGESVIHALSRFTELRVMSRNSSFRYKSQHVDASVVGQELGVGAVLVGRLRPDGDTIHIGIELVDATDNHTIWGERYDRKTSQLAGIEDEIASQTVQHMRLRIPPSEQALPADTRDSEAFRLYLEGNYNLSKLNEGNTLRAIQLFEQALVKDPHYALAWAGIAQGYNLLPYSGLYPATETLNKARAASQRALELNPNLAEAHTAMASIREDYDWDWAGAETEYKKAIDLNPSYGQARHWYSHFLSRMGRHQEAIEEAKRAVEVDPLSAPVVVNLAAAYVFARQFEMAILECRRAIQLDPNFADAHYVLAIAYREKGLHEEGIEEFRRQIAANNGNKYAIGFLGYAYAVSGRTQEAEKTIRELKAIPDVSPLAVALVYSGLGKDQVTLNLLEKALTARDPYVRYLKVDPCFERLRADSRFQDLLKRAGLNGPVQPTS